VQIHYIRAFKRRNLFFLWLFERRIVLNLTLYTREVNLPFITAFNSWDLVANLIVIILTVRSMSGSKALLILVVVKAVARRC